MTNPFPSGSARLGRQSGGDVHRSMHVQECGQGTRDSASFGYLSHLASTLHTIRCMIPELSDLRALTSLPCPENVNRSFHIVIL